MGRKRWIITTGLLLAGCGSIKMEQKDGCWVRHSDGFLRQEKEELGVCSRTPPQWSNDRVTRLVQECMVEADYRWKNEALSAWNRGQPLPPEPPEHEVMQKCMNDAATSLIRENESLGKKVAELTQEKADLVAQTRQSQQDLRDSNARMTDALGEAAKRPPPSAYALATSSGTANTKSDQAPPQQEVVVPTTVVPMQTLPGAPQPPPTVAQPGLYAPSSVTVVNPAAANAPGAPVTTTQPVPLTPTSVIVTNPGTPSGVATQPGQSVTVTNPGAAPASAMSPAQSVTVTNPAAAPGSASQAQSARPGATVKSPGPSTAMPSSATRLTPASANAPGVTAPSSAQTAPVTASTTTADGRGDPASLPQPSSSQPSLIASGSPRAEGSPADALQGTGGSGAAGTPAPSAPPRTAAKKKKGPQLAERGHDKGAKSCAIPKAGAHAANPLKPTAAEAAPGDSNPSTAPAAK